MEKGNVNDTIGQRIVAARKELGMKQVELAELIHVSERSMQAYEADEVEPFRKLKELSEVLNVPMSWILHGDKAEQHTGDLAPLLAEILAVLKEMAGRRSYTHEGDGASHGGPEKASKQNP